MDIAEEYKSCCVCAVIITFDPNVAGLKDALKSLIGQVANIIIVDNASKKEIVNELKNYAEKSHDKIHIISLPENVGIAEAQNIGVTNAYDYFCSHVLFMDHDSIPEENMVEMLLKAEHNILISGGNVGAVGPTLIDRRTQTRSGFVKRKGFSISRVYPADTQDEFVEADFIISSGTLVRREVLQNVGLMNAGYFIDHVDTEWCFRVTNLGYKIYGIRDAFLNHKLGENVVKIWLGRWREIPRHNDFRYYYIFRNTLVMVKKTAMPMSWKLAHLYRLAIFFVFFGFLCSANSKRWRFITQGLWDACKERMGQYKR